MRLWSASETRRRRWSLVVLGALAGLSAGLVTAAVSGAERSSSAYPRMRQQLLAADAVFFPSQVHVDDADVAKLGAIPEVEAWSGFALLPGWFDELGRNAGPFLPVGDGWFTTIERAEVLEGHLPDPDRDDEVVVNQAALDAGARVGRTFTFRSYTPDDYAKFGDEGTPSPEELHGPVTAMKVVGVVRMPMEFVLTFAKEPMIYPSPGWYAKHGHDVATYFTNAFVRLEHGAGDLPAFRQHVAQVYGRSDIPIKDLSDDIKRVQNATHLERNALLLFAAAALLASLVLVGQAFVRSVQAESDAVPTLSAMGLDPRSLAAGLALPHVVTVAVAAVVTVLTTVVLSARFPIGLARRVDPDLGYRVQPLYLLGGATAAIVATAAMAIGASWLTTRTALGRTTARRTRIVGAVSRRGASVPAAVGASLALEQTGGKGAVPVRPALAAATVAVLGVVGAVTLVGGIDDALHEPARSGRSWQLEATPTSVDQLETITQVPGVRSAALVSRFAATVDERDVPFYAIDDLKGASRFVVLRGRTPEGDEEVMLGARSAKVLGAGIGDEIQADSGGPPLHVVGVGLVLQTPHGAFDEGALVTMSTLDEASNATLEGREAVFVISADQGTKVATLQAALQRAGIDAAPPVPVTDVTNLANVRRLPLMLAGFLVLLGLGAVGHALLTVSRRRSKELAVLRAVGLTPRQTAACVTWQATVVAAVALLIGVPLGLFIGRQAWRLVADSIPLAYVGPLSTTLLAIVVPAVVAALLVLAVAPAWRAAHLETAETLRAE
jgi:ABC-type lipoprotein release transport system permease subunit